MVRVIRPIAGHASCLLFIFSRFHLLRPSYKPLACVPFVQTPSSQDLVRSGLDGRQSGRQALAALATAGIDDRPSAPGCHARPEPMSSGTLQEAWLESTFHFLDPFLKLVWFQPYWRSVATNGRQKRRIVTINRLLNKLFKEIIVVHAVSFTVSVAKLSTAR